MGTKDLVLLQLLFLFPRAILASNYGIISSYLDCTGSFLGCYEVEKRIDNPEKFLDLEGNILMLVLLKLLELFYLLFYHKMSELNFLHAIKLSEAIN